MDVRANTKKCAQVKVVLKRTNKDSDFPVIIPFCMSGRPVIRRPMAQMQNIYSTTCKLNVFSDTKNMSSNSANFPKYLVNPPNFGISFGILFLASTDFYQFPQFRNFVWVANPPSSR